LPCLYSSLWYVLSIAWTLGLLRRVIFGPRVWSGSLTTELAARQLRHSNRTLPNSPRSVAAHTSVGVRDLLPREIDSPAGLLHTRVHREEDSTLARSRGGKKAIARYKRSAKGKAANARYQIADEYGSHDARRHAGGSCRGQKT
jgi:hypothetical protein